MLKRILSRFFRMSSGATLDRYYVLKVAGFGVFIHHIHHSDPPNLYHNHPWDFLSISFPPWRGYIQLIQDKKPLSPMMGYVAFLWYHTAFTYTVATDFHRVVLVEDRPVWTLVIHGRKYNEWQLRDDYGKVLATQPWEGEGKDRDYKKHVFKK